MPVLKTLLALGAIVIACLTSGCPSPATMQGWTSRIRNARDAFLVSSPEVNNDGMQRVQVPFGWMIKISRRSVQLLELEHYSGALVRLIEKQSGHGSRVTWHMTFRRDGMSCVNARGFSYVRSAGVNNAKEPIITNGNPRNVNSLLVRWPPDEVTALQDSLNPRLAPGICTR